MNMLSSPRFRRFLTVLLFILVLVSGFYLSLQTSSQAQFDLPDGQPVRILVSPSPTPAVSPDPIARFRENRAQYFREMENALSDLAYEVNQDDAIAAHVLRTLEELTRTCRLTQLTESALIGLGYPDAVCAAAPDSITVFLGAPMDASSGQLLTDLICTWSGLPASGICLIEAR